MFIIQIKISCSYGWHNRFWKYCWREEELRQQEEEKHRQIQDKIRVSLHAQRSTLSFIEQCSQQKKKKIIEQE